MQLNTKQKEYVTKQISKGGKQLADVLGREFPSAEITIVRGHDRFDRSRYNYKACFSDVEAIAEKLIAECSPNWGDREIRDIFYLVRGTFICLQEGEVFDPETEKPLNGVDRLLIYGLLKSSLVHQ